MLSNKVFTTVSFLLISSFKNKFSFSSRFKSHSYFSSYSFFLKFLSKFCSISDSFLRKASFRFCIIKENRIAFAWNKKIVPLGFRDMYLFFNLTIHLFTISLRQQKLDHMEFFYFSFIHSVFISYH